MTGFLIEISGKGKIRFLYTAGEQIFKNGEQIIYVYGLSDQFALSREERIDWSHLRHEMKGTFTAVSLTEDFCHSQIIQSVLGGNKPLYYMEHESNFYVFTSLKLLSLLSYRCCFQENHDILCEFIYNGFIRSRDTLLKGIYKLLPEEYLEVGDGGITVKRFSRVTEKQGSVDLHQMYAREKCIIDSYIDLAVSQKGTIGIALSGGYDSSFIYHCVQNKKLPVHVCSVGGSRGLDETNIARLQYEHAGVGFFHQSYVDSDIRRHLKKIAEIYEGNLYERGVFLQYALAGLLKKHGISHVLLGECADQVFNQHFYEIKELEYLTNYVDHPYELGTMIVLKKSVFMLDYFGITGLYPYTDPRMLQLGAETMKENAASKAMHKQMCTSFLNEYVTQLIGKNPGTTSPCALFEDTAEEKAFMDYVKAENPFYDPAFRISYKYGPTESELDYYLCLEYISSFRKIFCG